MLKLVYKLLKDSFSVTDNIIYNLVITGFMVTVLNNFAYKCVSELYRADIIESRFVGSIISFIIKIILLGFALLIVRVITFIKGIF
jgi:hypothetical protein